MSDGEAFIENEPLVYGPMTEKPRYWLAWALETTQECNGPRDSRSSPRLEVAGGSLRIQVENEEVLDTDCDNVTPVRTVILDKDEMDRILRSATPRLRQELCKDYIGFPAGVDCEDTWDERDAILWVPSGHGYMEPLKKLKSRLLR